MTEEVTKGEGVGFYFPRWFWVALAIAAVVLSLPYLDALAQMTNRWFGSEEYSHAVFLPLLGIFFIWQQHHEISTLTLRGSWFGVLLVLAGFAVMMAGEIATLFVIIHYGYLLVIAGVALALSGWRHLPRFLPALILLFFTIPLPNFLYENLSSKLQLVSSELGVAFIRLFGVPVLLQGNVIDLGSMKLQVVEACSGLNYLFPLMSISFIMAYIYRAPLWQRVLVFVSAAPITVVMNSIRIGIIGISVEHFGDALTEGFLHFFEGWVVFMVSLGLLVAEIWILNRLLGRGQSFGEAFALTLPPRLTRSSTPRPVPRPLLAAFAVVLLASSASLFLPEREEQVPQRLHFSTYPMFIEQWVGRRQVMESVYLDALKFDDYALIDYTDDGGNIINFYSAYYASQRKGQSAHSPRSCLPGGGWRIDDLREVELPLSDASEALKVNRVLISHGDQRQLVYYWFRQQGKNITSEYLVKWQLFVDGLLNNRTDGALLRFTMPVGKGEDIEARDRLLQSFIVLHYPTLSQYVPN